MTYIVCEVYVTRCIVKLKKDIIESIMNFMRSEVVNTPRVNELPRRLLVQPITWNALDVNGTYVIDMYGVLKTLEVIRVRFKEFSPYFYVRTHDDEKLPTCIKYTKKEKAMVKPLLGFSTTPVLMHKLIFRSKKMYFNALRVIGNIDSGIDVYGSHLKPYVYMFHTVGLVPMLPMVIKHFVEIPDINENADVCIETRYTNVKSMPASTEFLPFLRMAFDIETYSAPRGTPPVTGFPSAQELSDKIIQIGITFEIDGTPGSFMKVVLSLSDTINDVNGTASTSNLTNFIGNGDVDVETKVIEYRSELELIIGFGKLVHDMNPDIVYGYNSHGFDWSYIFDRLKTIDYTSVKKFMKLIGRRGSAKDMDRSFQNSASGFNAFRYPETYGRLDIDIMKVVKRIDTSNYGKKLDSHTLKHVSNVYLGDSKEDMGYQEMFDYYIGGSIEGMQKVASYVTKDAELCHALYRYFDITNKDFLTANVAFIPVEYLYFRGEQVKAISHIERLLMSKGMQMKKLTYIKSDESESPPGGYVGTGIVGMHRNISVLDFSSLYPTTMIGHNISHDMLISVVLQSYDLPEHARAIKSALRPEMLGSVENIQNTYEPLGPPVETVYYEDSMLPDSVKYTYTVSFVTLVKDRGVKKGSGQKNIIAVNVYTCTYVDETPEHVGILCLMEERLLASRGLIKKKYPKVKSEIKVILSKLRRYFDEDIINAAVTVHNTTTLISDSSPEGARVASDRYMELMSVMNKLKLTEMAYKVMANSLYGQTCALHSPLYNICIAGSITTTGKHLIKETSSIIEARFVGARIIYGDTDSVFINMFGLFANILFSKRRNVYKRKIKAIVGHVKRSNKTLEYVTRIMCDDINIVATRELTKTISDKMSEICNDAFNRKTINIEFEKILDPFFFFAKKHYFGAYYDVSMSTPSQILCKGLNVKQRGVPEFYVKLYTSLMHTAVENSPEQMHAVFMREIRRLLSGDVPLENLSLSVPVKPLSAYKESSLRTSKGPILLQRISERESPEKVASISRIHFTYFIKPFEYDNTGRELGTLQGAHAETLEYMNEHGLRANVLMLFKGKFSKELKNLFIAVGDVESYRVCVGLEVMYAKFGQIVHAVIKKLLVTKYKSMTGQIEKIIVKYDITNNRPVITNVDIMYD